MNRSEFGGKVVVVAGGGCGIGPGVARAFAQAGARVVVADTDSQLNIDAVGVLIAQGLSVTFESLDVRDSRQCTAVADKAIQRFGQIDVWVNNASVAYHNRAETLPKEQWDDCIAVILSGTFYCAQAAGRCMLERGTGVIINISSVLGLRGTHGLVSFCAARAGVIMLTQSLGIEWARRGVRVVGIAPGVGLTGEFSSKVDTPEMIDFYRRRTPMRRLGKTQEVAQAALYLASSEASYVVAETLCVDGGWLAYTSY
jgi:NAD(P)-dependent dehydrogenase (short-subunit alcohol dehydrogenase family)